jgi:hypothetical protein
VDFKTNMAEILSVKGGNDPGEESMEMLTRSEGEKKVADTFTEKDTHMGGEKEADTQKETAGVDSGSEEGPEHVDL